MQGDESGFEIAVANRQKSLKVDAEALRGILLGLLRQSVEGAELSVAVVRDEEMSRLNEQFLGRSGPTDVLSFPYGSEAGRLEGEVIVDAEEALRQSELVEHGAEEELLLYVVHGVLHLLGYDDATPEQRRRMNERAMAVLEAAGRRLDARTLLEE